MKSRLFALSVGLLFAALIAHATPGTVEPAPAPVYPLAIVCVEQPGTSDARPCEPWCDRWVVSHVLRFMRIERADGRMVYEWREADCASYLAERLAI